MVTLNGIRCFCTVLESGSFRLAAERLHRSQPAVTQQIKHLERDLGQVLLVRKGCLPTPAGQLVYERGLQMLTASDDLRAEMQDFDEAAGRDLRIGTSDTNALYFLPRHVSAFLETMPQTRLVVHCHSSDAIADKVIRGELDLGIVTLPLEREGLNTRNLFEQRLVLVVPAAHPLAARRSTTLSRLRDEAFVLIRQDTRTGRKLSDFFRARDFVPHTVMDSGSFEVIKQYVAAGLGLSFLPEMVLRKHDRASVAVLNVKGLPRVGIGAIWRVGAYQTKAARAFLDWIAPGQAPRSKRPAEA